MTRKSARKVEQKRGYELGKRLEQMAASRRAVLQAAREQLERQGYKEFSLASLAAESGVTRQTIHNLFGTKRQLLEALFDSIAIHGGMEQMRSVMTLSDASAMLSEFVRLFCGFWGANQLLFRRIHGIGAIDPDFGELVVARNERRFAAAGRIAKKWKNGKEASEAAVALTAATSFEFYDAAAQCGFSAQRLETLVIKMAFAAVEL